jgi:hypothetical protein
MVSKIQHALDMQNDLRTDYALILLGTGAALIALLYLVLS